MLLLYLLIGVAAAGAIARDRTDKRGFDDEDPRMLSMAFGKRSSWEEDPRFTSMAFGKRGDDPRYDDMRKKPNWPNQLMN